ncbi:DUF3426 domain-containing protein [Deefgea piscis]|uniref:DUF3426 domain-containing protein n=1 Tax=Deefgea piscis TaxID=2739061 RepID=A0A6M8SVU5_9NEIS|nr:DUF3426 domain-containing protein [Deefgea piscis]QKJ68168.1 DUF3426 domain-containing protein [Deefgea piscis]
MNQITCCPNCSTAFRVTDQQLSAHQGKVRCGRCAFVFHAPDFMQAPIASNGPSQSDDAEISSIPAQAPPVEPEQQLNQTETIATVFEPLDTQADQQGIDAEPLINKGDSNIPDDIAQEIDLLQFEVLARNNSSNVEPALETESEPQSQVETAASPSAAQDPTLAMEIELALAAAAATEDTSQPVMSAPNQNHVEIDSNAEYQPILSDDDLFVPHKKTAQHTGWWALASLLAVMILVLQLLYQFRLELSQDFPALRPKYLALCAKLDCAMPLPQKSPLLRSEYSELSFIPNNPQLIQLNATLRNLAPFAQALPKLELTLTDDNERVIVRKVFTAKQYLLQNERQQDRIEANEEIPAFLQLDLGDLHSTGYSLLWFY